MEAFNIVEHNGNKVGTNEKLSAVLMDPAGKMFLRRAIKWSPEGQKNVDWLVISLDGVNVYVQDNNNIVVTKENLRP